MIREDVKQMVLYWTEEKAGNLLYSLDQCKIMELMWRYLGLIPIHLYTHSYVKYTCTIPDFIKTIMETKGDSQLYF